MNRKSLREAIEAARRSPAYANYLEAKERVLDMLDRREAVEDGPSGYWAEETAGLDYILDASPLIVAKLREHCYHLTGIRSYEYRGHHAHKSRPFAEKLASLRRVDPAGLLVGEPALLGGFGHRIEGALINIDTLKFYECLIALELSGALAPFREAGGRGKAVLEIGAGWGGFAYQFKTLFPEASYIIVDLPQSLLFSATYLKTAFPGEPLRLVTGTGATAPAGRDRGFVLVPHFLFREAGLETPDLAINMVSFQEMTTAQVRGYVGHLRRRGAPTLYSLNRDRSSHNDQLTSVSSVLSEFYRVKEIPVLEAPYTTLGPVPPPRGERPGPSEQVYRHLLATTGG